MRKSAFSILGSQKEHVAEILSDQSVSSRERMLAVGKIKILKNQETIDSFVDTSMTLPKLSGKNLQIKELMGSRRSHTMRMNIRTNRNKVKITRSTIE